MLKVLDAPRLAELLLFPLPRFLVHLMIAVFVLAGATSGNHVHLHAEGHHDSGHGSHLAATQEAAPVGGSADGQSDLDKTSCDYSHHASCSTGHCCFPVPRADLPTAKADEPLWEIRVGTWERREERLDPPPPKRV